MIPRIRPMTNEDKISIIRILHDTSEFKPNEVIVAEEVIDSYLRDPAGSGYHVVVAEISGRVVGYLAYGPAPLTEGTWDLYWAAICSEERGHGAGSALVSHAEDEIRRAKGRLAVIETSSKPEYDRTRRFHRKMGYKLACRVKGFYAPDDDKMVFLKRLDPECHTG